MERGIDKLSAGGMVVVSRARRGECVEGGGEQEEDICW